MNIGIWPQKLADNLIISAAVHAVGQVRRVDSQGLDIALPRKPMNWHGIDDDAVKIQN
jgi:hypothetical protein